MYKVILFVLVVATSILAQDSGLKWGGYLENSAAAIYDDDSVLFTNNTTFRLESVYETQNSKVDAAIVYSKQFAPIDPRMSVREGSIMDNMYYDLYEFALQNIPDSSRQEWDEFLLENQNLIMFMVTNVPYTGAYPTDQFIIDRGALSLYFKHVSATFGVQQIAWGTGYAFNPTDLWNAKNPADPTATKKGVPALRAEVPTGQLSGLDFIFAPSTSPKASSGGIRFNSNAFNFDYSVSLSRFLGADRQLALLPEKVVAGFDVTGDIVAGIGVWAELALSNPKYTGFDYYNTDSAYAQADIGLTYTFETGITVLAEYYYNGLGQNSYKNYNLEGFIYLYSGDMVGYGKHYIMPGLQYTFLDDYDLSLFTLLNMGDKSQMFMPQIEYHFNEDIAINLMGTFGIGDQYKSEYGSINHSGTLRVTGWF